MYINNQFISAAIGWQISRGSNYVHKNWTYKHYPGCNAGEYRIRTKVALHLHHSCHLLKPSMYETVSL